MQYGSVCSGIEAATVAWEPLGWTPAWFSEIEEFPKRVLDFHYPEVKNLGDMTKIYDNEIFKKKDIDILVGGTPCQSFSIAGTGEG
jgi:DNA (cytosine-5)-methyltransferase 1